MEGSSKAMDVVSSEPRISERFLMRDSDSLVGCLLCWRMRVTSRRRKQDPHTDFRFLKSLLQFTDVKRLSALSKYF